jgi:DNA modification methylase
LNFTEYESNYQSSVWDIAVPQSNFSEGKYHPCQKPLELYRRIISSGTKKGELVLDCFAGSGTTGVICKELERSGILIEKEEKYIKLIKGRINSVV